MVNFIVKAILIILVLIFIYCVFVSIDLNTVIFWIKLMNTTRIWKQRITDDELYLSVK